MHLRLRLAFGLASLAIVVACSSDELKHNPPTVVPDGPIDTTPTSMPDAGPQLGEPITGAKAGEWTFIPFADSSCANGTPTGIGINLGTSKDLVIYLEGGGACWDETTCYGATPYAQNLDGWDEAKFKARMKTTGGSHIDRIDEKNPFRDANLVYIPYCTGDIHVGDKEQTYGGKLTKHVGRRNVQAFLARLAPTFKDAHRVVVTGSSAGGFGAAVSYWRAAEYWPKTRVDLVDDSGPPFPTEKIAPFSDWAAAWDVQGAVAPGCAECADGNVSALFPYYAKTYPKARFAFLSHDHDYIISLFFGMSEADFASELADVTTKLFESTPNAKAFEVSGTEHTMLGDLSTTSNGHDLATWLSDMESDSASWTTVHPGD